MNPQKKYRVWSLISRKYLVLKKNGDNAPTAQCTGTGKEQSSIFTVIRNDTSAIPGEVSYHFVVRANDGTQYVLQVHEQATPATFDFQPFTAASKTTSAFVPASLGITSGSFKALKVANSRKCIASNEDGDFSIKSFKLDESHPESIFVVSEID